MLYAYWSVAAKKAWAFGLASRGSILSGRIANVDLGDQPERGRCVLWRIREELLLTPGNPDRTWVVYLKLNCRGSTPALVAARLSAVGLDRSKQVDLQLLLAYVRPLAT